MEAKERDTSPVLSFAEELKLLESPVDVTSSMSDVRETNV